MVLPRSGEARNAGSGPPYRRVFRRDPAPGHRHLRGGAEGTEVPHLRPGPLQRPARERSSPLPLASGASLAGGLSHRHQVTFEAATIAPGVRAPVEPVTAVAGFSGAPPENDGSRPRPDR